MQSIAGDVGTLVRKELELARQELLEALIARLIAAGALGAAGALALAALVFAALAAAAALDMVMSGWASRLVVAGAFILMTAAGGVFGLGRIRRPPMTPEQTKLTVKEDVEWAKARLRR